MTIRDYYLVIRERDMSRCFLLAIALSNRHLLAQFRS